MPRTAPPPVRRSELEATALPPGDYLDADGIRCTPIDMTAKPPIGALLPDPYLQPGRRPRRSCGGEP